MLKAIENPKARSGLTAPKAANTTARTSVPVFDIAPGVMGVLIEEVAWSCDPGVVVTLVSRVSIEDLRKEETLRQPGMLRHFAETRKARCLYAYMWST